MQTEGAALSAPKAAARTERTARDVVVENDVDEPVVVEIGETNVEWQINACRINVTDSGKSGIRVDPPQSVHAADGSEELGRGVTVEIEEEKGGDTGGQSSQSSQPGPGASGSAVRKASVSKASRGTPNKKARYYEIAVTDNGSGMEHAAIPQLLGVVLSGTKYGVKQTRGKFGLGAKMALIWAKSSTGVPIEVYSATEGAATVSYYKLDIDIERNRPHVVEEGQLENTQKWRGTKLVVTIEGSWKYQKRILEYMRMMAILTPYAWFRFAYTGVRKETSFEVQYPRRVNAELPRAAVEVKHHPRSLNLVLIDKLLAQVKPSTALKKFLTSEFSSVSAALARKIAEELHLDPATKVSQLPPEFGHHLLQLFREIRIPEPSGDCLSPAGQYNLFLGIKKEIKPTLVATYQERAHVYEGHPFIVEVGVSIGGESMEPGVTVYRYANRIPLLFEPGNDVATITAREFKWSTYKIRPTLDKIGVFVSIVSTHIPFKGTGKEYIGNDATPIKAAIKAALRKCCISLKKKIATRGVDKAKVDRKRKLAKFIPDVSRAMHGMLATMADERATKKPRGLSAADDALLDAVASGAVTVGTLETKLRTHIDKADAEGAFQFVAKNVSRKSEAVPLSFRPVPLDSLPDVAFSKRGLVLRLSSQLRAE
ncbi:DNA topoisomerase 6 subunit B [Thecamonas trahens ATCC 50062]|uniref:DNA topoisomerase 6 subunit B n=1 Tax=Thecamonas trahens ATCC 50062 TaxID=461836 RepID=A0A0L0DLL5_THETB|nr:DNA topoisomerase 6 subunit B [Thecamonas trahens ATCC 50062]KNC53140.1 DNA topoisomerase 6 subunit B [Thecamonas trahens ATCC 50062]|eukprot:XP_013754614.1 DNA topoisomerase 6 subunit B [Thecamonas trahens ATCC 50062]